MSKIQNPSDIRDTRAYPPLPQAPPGPPTEPLPTPPKFVTGTATYGPLCQWHGKVPAEVFDIDGCWCSPKCRDADRESASWAPMSMAALAFEAAAVRVLGGAS